MRKNQQPRKKSDEYRDLLDAASRYRTIEKLADVIWSVNLDLHFTYVSEAVTSLLGYTQQEALAMKMDDLLMPVSIQLVHDTLADAMKREAAGEYVDVSPAIEVMARHKDESIVWLELSRMFLRDESGTPVGVIGVARDITDRVHALRAMEESEARYRALAEKSVVGIVIAQDNPVRFSYVNNTMAKMVGYSKEELLRMSAEETFALVHPEDREEFFGRFRERLEDKSMAGALELRGFRKNGTIIPLEVHGVRIDYEGEPAVLATFVDISDRHQAREEMTNARKFAEFLLDLMGHDLNNIHQGLMTSLELLSGEDYLSRNGQRLIKSSLSQVKRAVTLIKNVRRLSEVKSKGAVSIPMDLGDTIRLAVDSVRKTFPSKDVTINSDVESGQYIVLGCQFLYDAFFNLLHNAVKVDERQNVIIDIHAKVSTDGSVLHVAIADRGRGIPDSKKESVLTRLGGEQVSTSGVGLTLVQQIVEQCQGEIWVEDRVQGDYSQGAKFVVALQLMV
ncbi:MAG: PAS domain S-box protein [Candidatus Thorarchaeota archaeon]